jgi:hypothetical protein
MRFGKVSKQWGVDNYVKVTSILFPCCPLKRDLGLHFALEDGWQSGLMRTLGKRVYREVP